MYHRWRASTSLNQTVFLPQFCLLQPFSLHQSLKHPTFDAPTGEVAVNRIVLVQAAGRMVSVPIKRAPTPDSSVGAD